ncbi:MAG: polyprenyl diphosphate synthase [Nitrososphaerales archaeon]
MWSSALRFLLVPVYGFYESWLSSQIGKETKPKHVGVILDGNRRYANHLGFDSRRGHEIGSRRGKDFLIWCLDYGIENITLFAFSTENFSRPKDEVDEILEIITERFLELADDPIVHKNEVRIRALGRLEMLPDELRAAIDRAAEVTKNYDNFTLNVALAYGGRTELVDATVEIARQVKNGLLSPKDVTEGTITKSLYLPDLPPLDIILRTSGEKRLSNFMLWQSLGSFVVFIDIYWPEIRKIDLARSIRTFQSRSGTIN